MDIHEKKLRVRTVDSCLGIYLLHVVEGNKKEMGIITKLNK